jgi:alpha-L-fucosidase
MRTPLTVFVLAALTAAQNFVDVKPSPQQVQWQDLEFGVLIHFGPNTFMDREWGEGNADPSVFNPTQFDPEQWVLAAKSAGAKYLVMVAKHHDGFCLWPSRYTEYSVKHSPWKNGKGDVVGDVARAARKHGLKLGVYLSPWDRHEPAYQDNKKYDEYYRNELRELASNYGDLVEWWLDGAGSEGHLYDFDSYVKELRTYQPNTLLFADVGFLSYGDIRWVGNEAGFAAEDNWNVVDRLGYLRWRPAEADTPLRKLHWFWHPNDEKSLNTVAEMLDIYHKTVGRGAQLVLGLAPDNRGLLPDSDVARLREFGDELRRIYGRNQGGQIDWRAPPGSHEGVVEFGFNAPMTFDRAVSSEWLSGGQRVQNYIIEIREGAGDSWRWIASGTTIGHKKIDIFPRVTALAVRLNILSASDAPVIREFLLYDGKAR